MSTFRRRLMGKFSFPNYLCFTAIEDGTFTFTYGSNVFNNGGKYIEYSTNGIKWYRLNAASFQSVSFTTPTIKAGKQVYWRGDNATLSTNSGNTRSTFSSTGKFNAKGDVRSLLAPKKFDNITLSGNNGMAGLFMSSKIVDASNLLLLPPTSLAAYKYAFKSCIYLVSAPYMDCSSVEAYACSEMFKGCSSLATVPFEISCSNFKSNAFAGMFTDCTSLTTAPIKGGHYNLATQACKEMFRSCSSLVNVEDIYIDSLGSSGIQHMQNMFNGCTSLKKNPIRSFPSQVGQYCFQSMFENCKFNDWGEVTLPAATLVIYCYASMFKNSNVGYIKILATDVSASECTTYWLGNVSNVSSNIIVKHIDATWTNRGASGVPSNWTILYYNPSTEKYYLSDKTTECDKNGNVI